jgi:hypothetical protein
MTIFVPLFSQSLFEAKGDKEGNLVEAAVSSIATMASQLEWGTYYGLLMRLFKLTSGKGAPHQRAIVRAVCGVLERFHFFVGDGGGLDDQQRFVGAVMGEETVAAEGAIGGVANNPKGVGLVGGMREGGKGRIQKGASGVNKDDKEGTAERKAGLDGNKKGETVGEQDIGDKGKPEKPGTITENDEAKIDKVTKGVLTPANTGVKSAGGRIVPSDIQALLLRRVFPELRKSMVEEPDKKGEDGIVSTPVTLALVQVLQLLPPRAMEVELPRLLHEVANLLKSRAQWVRDAARGAMVAISQVLGAR